MRVKILIVIIALFCIVSFGMSVHAQSDVSGERIDLMDVTVRVNYDASIDVVENITYNFDDLHRHGIYRDIPVKYKTNAGGTFRLGLKDISVADENGNPYSFTTSGQGSSERIKIGDPNQTITGVHQYIISYKVDNPIGFFTDYDEIYWNATGNEWTVPIAAAKAKVILPKGLSKEDLGRIACYRGSLGSKSTCEWYRVGQGEDFANTIKYDSVEFNNSGILYPGQGMTIAVGFPKGIVDGSKAPTQTEKVFGNFFYDGWWWLIVPIIAFIFFYRKWSREGRDPKGTGVIIPQYDVPDSLSPMEAKYIMNYDFSNSIVGETIILASKGYIRINKIIKSGIFASTEDFEIEKLKNADQNLTSFQVLLLNGFFSSVTDSYIEYMRISQSLPNSANDPNSSVASKLLLFPFQKIIEKTKEKVDKSVERVLVDQKVRLSELQYKFYSIKKMMESDIIENLVNKGYYPPAKVKKILGVVPVGNMGSRIVSSIILSLFFLIFVGMLGMTIFGLVFFISLIATLVVISIFYVLMPRMTEKGILTREKVLGFKLYLSVAEKDRINFHNAPERNIETFEKFLPYAIAFGIVEKWEKVFEGITMQSPGWYSDSTGAAFSLHAFSTSMSSFASLASQSLGTAPGSSSGSGGGGSSGGGGGGGGGGSW